MVTATVDARAGEVGTIYQAAGFDYVGPMRKGTRAVIRLSGKHMSERAAQQLVGTQGTVILARLGFDAISVPRKKRYFAFLGHKRERAQHRAAIAERSSPIRAARQLPQLVPALGGRPDVGGRSSVGGD